ncbi:MAG TPA: carboxyl transferase domain-containing protein, partial [Candidatus Berkiella sp.]|nr:carboxyl transferase domain-containing protein [Candidatus Berkiella sp.]
ISVMGGEQAASVLVQVKKAKMEKEGETWTQAEEQAFIEKITAQYDKQGHPYYSSARLWDDGVIDPLQTRDVLGLALSACLNAPIDETEYGIFRI